MKPIVQTLRCAAVAAVLMLLALPVAAQEQPPAPVEGAVAVPVTTDLVQDTMTLSEIIETGGVLMYVLGLMSIVGLAFVIYFFVVMRESQVVPRRFWADLRRLLVQGRMADAISICKHHRSPIAVVARSALEYTERVDEAHPGMVRELLEGEGSRQATLIQNQTQYLLDIGVIAPMVGLLGTVIGMLKTFNVVALNVAMAKPMQLAAGVSQALVTTATGLIVGIPAMIFYAYFRGKSSKLISSLETASAELLTHIAHTDDA